MKMPDRYGMFGNLEMETMNTDKITSCVTHVHFNWPLFLDLLQWAEFNL